MWRQLYEKVKQQQRREGDAAAASTPTDARLRSSDGGFFEKLGELLKKHAEEQRRGDSPATFRAANGRAVPPDVTFAVPEEPEAATEPADNAKLLSDALSSNIEALYIDVLHMVLNTVGCNGEVENDNTSLFTYLQAAFKFDDEKHNELMEQARTKEAPDILLHVEIVEAKDLAPMDVNGLSDSFCTLYLTSTKNQQYNTTVKMATLNPEWKEHFCLPVANSSEDSLGLEVWDFDPAETIGMKMKKIGNVKGMKGWGKLVREFGSTGKNENEFIGSTILPLKGINATGETRWCDLEKKGRTGKRGSVKVELVFSSQKNTVAAFKDHRNLLRLLLLYELESTNVEPYHWNGRFATPAETILTQHLIQSGLSTTIDPLVKWIEYCNVHSDHPISFEIFSVLLKKLLPALQSNLFSREKEILFWEATKTLIPSCFNAIKRLHVLTPNEKNLIQMAALLRVISYLRCLKLPDGFELFPSSMYGWLLPLEDVSSCDVTVVAKHAIVQGTKDWYDDMFENNIINYHSSSGDERLNHLIIIVKNAMKDLRKATEIYDKIFQETLQLAYAMAIYSAHGYKISELVEPVIDEVYQTLKPLNFRDDSPSDANDDDALGLGMQLFDLYLTLQRFVVSGSGLSSEEEGKEKLSKYYVWFHKSVAQWLDIALWKALKRIKKAVELDNLVPVSDAVKYSSSAPDTLGIFNQIKIFWQQLSWPDVEGSYVFVAKIIDDICHCSVYYSDSMSEKIGLRNIGSPSDNKFEVTKEWCRAINNIEYIWHSIEPFVNELGMNDIVNELVNIKNSSGAEQCRQTLQLVIDNTVETVGDKIAELLQSVAQKMIPAINKFLLEGAEVFHKGDFHIEKLTQYLDRNLIILHSELSSEIFQQMLIIIWEKVATILLEIVDYSLQEKRSRSYFNNLQNTLDKLLYFFEGGDEQGQIRKVETLKEVQKILSVHSMETPLLIHKFYLERLEEQQSMESAPLGIVTIFAEFVGDLLRIQILSGRNLQPMDKNGSCDPYVEVVLLPAEKFIGIQRQRTKTHKKTLFPLFDETFTFKLTHNQRDATDGMVLFTVKDQDMLGNELVGETLICFSEIKNEGKDASGELQQIHLKLSVPKNLDSQVSKALQLRQGDKVAREFIKKQRAKAGAC